MIPFNKPYISGKELAFVEDAMRHGLSGNGKYTKKCLNYFRENYGFKNAYLTHSCTAALEMCALLLDLSPNDEVILPSYTFTSTANAFALRGAKLRFVDSQKESPNICLESVASSINHKTKAIIVVHYAGLSCDMDALMDLANAHNLCVIEDAAQAINSKYKDRFLGSFGHLSTFSFHDTKNIHCGEGGLLVVNKEKFIGPALTLLNYGTNREEFIEKKVPNYEWCGLGSSFLCADLNAAVLWGQLQSVQAITDERTKIWNYYHQHLKDINACCELPHSDEGSEHNGHIYYLTCENRPIRDELIAFLKKQGVQAVFHYNALHTSRFFESQYDRSKNAKFRTLCRLFDSTSLIRGIKK